MKLITHHLTLRFRQRASNQPPIPLLHRAISLSSPSIRLRNVRRSIKTIQTPSPLDERQRARQGIVWIFRAAERGRRGGPRDQRIAREILAVLEGESDVFKWLEERHKQAALVRSVGFLWWSRSELTTLQVKYQFQGVGYGAGQCMVFIQSFCPQ